MSQAANFTTEHRPSSTTLYFGPWYRKSPYFEATLRYGCSAYDIYNHMYLPPYFHVPGVENGHLLEHVTLGDGAESPIAQGTGPAACRSTTNLPCPQLT